MRSRASRSGPSRSTQSASCAKSRAGAIASDVATMLPTMIFNPSARALSPHRERLGQTAGLVELDVHRVVARGDAFERGAVVHRLVGADRNAVGRYAARVSSCRREAAARPARPRLRRRHPTSVPASSGRQASLASAISLALRHGFAHRGEALRIAIAAELELEQGIGACFARLRRHRFGRGERERKGRVHGLERAEPRKL